MRGIDSIEEEIETLKSFFSDFAARDCQSEYLFHLLEEREQEYPSNELELVKRLGEELRGPQPKREVMEDLLNTHSVFALPYLVRILEDTENGERVDLVAVLNGGWKLRGILNQYFTKVFSASYSPMDSRDADRRILLDKTADLFSEYCDRLREYGVDISEFCAPR